MNAKEIIGEEMTLEQKLAAIDAAMKDAAVDFNRKNGRPDNAPVDPGDLLQCDGCQ